jgi:hypothetical protein
MREERRGKGKGKERESIKKEIGKAMGKTQ